MHHISKFIFIAILFVSFYSCAFFDKNGDVFMKNLSKKLSTENRDTITFSIDDLVSFDWDDLFIFPPYSDDDRINKELGFNWSNGKAEETAVKHSDQIVLFVFVKKNKVVKYFSVDTIKDFAYLKGIKYSKEKAKFIAIKRGERLYSIKDL